jgi:hypothetical protein
MAIQVEVMLLHMMRIINDARRPRGAEMAPTLELLSTTTDSALPSFVTHQTIGNRSPRNVLCVYDFFSMDASKPYRFLEAV